MLRAPDCLCVGMFGARFVLCERTERKGEDVANRVKQLLAQQATDSKGRESLKFSKPAAYKVKGKVEPNSFTTPAAGTAFSFSRLCTG